MKGIPTGNCISRQVADITLHYLLFFKLPRAIPTQANFWKRFIDDVFGFWQGTERSFKIFVDHLNSLTGPLGIKFGDYQVGHTVNFLDMVLSVSSSGVSHTLYRKETDARLYLKTDSFHPEHVFRSVVISQMIRIINRNSNPSPLKRNLDELREDLLRSGHRKEILDELEPLAKRRALGIEEVNRREPENGVTLVYSVKYYAEVEELRALVRDCQGSIDLVTGYPTRVIMALKKGAAIGNEVVRNRKLSLSESQPAITPQNQRCNGKGCKTCPILFETPQTVVVNGSCLKLDLRLTCKSSGVIYVANCVICGESYFGQTHSALHIRMNGHRSKFKTDQLAFEQSALSYHCFLKHRDKDNFSISSFRIGIVKRVSAMELDRFEEFFIESFGTRVNGLNRIAVVR